jgi:hypothetical protein
MNHGKKHKEKDGAKQSRYRVTFVRRVCPGGLF